MIRERKRIISKLTIDLLSTYRRINKKKTIEDESRKVDKKVKLNNEGYDDENDDYIVRQETWDDRFSISKTLGKGSFGQVVEATDLTTHERVAIKIIKNRSSFAKQALIEIRILKLLNSRDFNDQHCVVRMKEHFTFRNHLCIVYEIMSINLYELLRKGRFQGLPLTLIRNFAVQILSCLKFLSRSDIQIIHCDLKPENILLKDIKKPTIKVIDFGSSCFYDERAYSYIQSRFYRSPEVILGLPYATSIDMWSLGCILVELLSGEPLFAGKNEHDQMCRITDLLGLPPTHLIESAPQDRVRKLFVKVRQGEYRLVPVKKFTPRNMTLSSLVSELIESKLKNETVRFNGSDPLGTVTDHRRFIDLVERMLVFDPSSRLTPEQALQHPFLKPMMNRSINTDYTWSDLTKRGGMVGETPQSSFGNHSATPTFDPVESLSNVASRRRFVMDS